MAATATRQRPKADSGLTYTPLEDIPVAVERVRAAFNSGLTQDVDWRRRQIKGVKRLVQDNAKAIATALSSDLGRPDFESLICEVAGVAAEADFALANLDAWLKPEERSTPMTQKPGSSAIYSEPYGLVLIIGPWNFPLSLLLQPIISAFAAGNTIVIKPSEVACYCAKLLGDLLPKYVDTNALAVIQGGVPETTALLNIKFDHIMYTGNGLVGRIVMRAAAKHLTGVTLELGGKSPCIVDNSFSDYGVVARRILAGKLLNNGQVCIAPDYILVEASAQNKLVKALKETLLTWHGKDAQKSKDLGRVINERHFDRLMALLDSHTGDIAHGGKHDRSDLYIEPTILTDVSVDSKIMQDEIFGPLLPIIPVKNVADAIAFINQRDKPLALYIFSKSSKVQSQVLGGTSSGGVCINDTIMHIANPHLPFGGVGPSGTGSYHGKHGFDAFSHQRGVMTKPTWLDPSVRYPPYTDGKMRMVNMMLGGLPTIPTPVKYAAVAAGAYLWFRTRSKL